jgi:hypothetical protein
MVDGRTWIGVVGAAAALVAAAAPHATVAARGDDVRSPNVSLVASPPTGPGGDMAFWGDVAILAHGQADGNPANDGFLLMDISDPRHPRRLGRFICPDAFDVSVWQDLVFVSVGNSYAGPSCAAGPVPPVDPGAFAGIRIVSIEDPRRPRQIAAVATGFDPATRRKGSHTHTILPDLLHRDGSGRPAPRVLVYSSGGGGETDVDEEVVAVPLRDPASAEVVARIDTAPAASCHDVSFFMPSRVAAATCAAAGTQIWDVADPLAPRLLSTIQNPNISHHHGAAFSNDGKTLVIADESLAAIATGTCNGGRDSTVGALWFYDVADPTAPTLDGYFQLPRGAGGICTAHQLNVVPLRSDRDVLVAAWYLGGTTIVDFSDPANPREVGYFQASPADPARRSNPWASYWYNGFVYANQLDEPTLGLGTDRGLDILRVRHPYLRKAMTVRSFNFGTQLCTFGPYGRDCSGGASISRRAARFDSGPSSATGLQPVLTSLPGAVGSRRPR